MFSDRHILLKQAVTCRAWLLAFLALPLVWPSCVPGRKLADIRKGHVQVMLSLGSDDRDDIGDFRTQPDFTEDNLVVENDSGPVIMNAVREAETGEMVAVDVITASRVVARFRNIAERYGNISLGFDIIVPPGMLESVWKLKFTPVLKMGGDSVFLEPVCVTGSKYREAQLAGYKRYRAFIASIITDTADFVRLRLLEKFLERYFPETYSMKNDSSLIPEPMAENVFGVTQREALDHYTRLWMKERNERKINSKDEMFRKYVKDPLKTEGIRLDTVIRSSDGKLAYRYSQEMKSRPGLKKISVSLSGELYENGKPLLKVKRPEELVFYVSSLSTLADMSPKYMVKIIGRNVYDNTHAFIDFHSGSALIDTSLSVNASEFGRIRRCLDDLVCGSGFELDSLRITASCSPEGAYDYNAGLAKARSKAISDYLNDYVCLQDREKIITAHVPENWRLLEMIVRSDTVISPASRRRMTDSIMMLKSEDSGDGVTGREADKVEESFRTLPEYIYLREKIYPRLRTVRFDFYLHRKGMVKDTVHTSVVDSVYMSGLEAIENLEYRRAVEILSPYRDYNAALAFLAAGYEQSALAVLEELSEQTAKSLYLASVASARLGNFSKSFELYRKSVESDPSMSHRANLDPEISDIVRRYE